MAKRNLVLHCHKPAVNADKIYMCCIRENVGSNGTTEWIVLAKWGRRGNKMNVADKGTFSTEVKAIQCQVALYKERLKEGYLDIESIEYQGHILKIGGINPLSLGSKGIQEYLEREDGASTGFTPKKIVWRCERCGKDFEPEIGPDGIPLKGDAFCPDCIAKVKEAAKKAAKRMGDEDAVLICVDNVGLEDRFDVGIEYLVEDHADKTMVYVYDKMGRKDEYFRARFTTTERWERKHGKMKATMVKNRETGKNEKPVFMPLVAGQTVNIQTIAPDGVAMPKHFGPPTSATMPTRNHFAGV